MIKSRIANAGGKPARIMIFGIEGAGKSTFGANADKPVFITPEGGADHLRRLDGKPVSEMENVSTWDQVRRAIRDLIKEPHDFKTCVIDSADWLEKICHAKIIGQSDKDIIRVNGGYSAGLREAEKMHRELIEDLSKLRNERNMHIIITAHYQVKEVKDPDAMEDYDAYQIKCDERVSSLYREWVDALLFVRFSTFLDSTKKDDARKRARALGTDERIVYTVKRPAFQAKNRYGLPPEMPFTEDFWQVLKPYINRGAQPEKSESIEEVYDEVRDLMKKVEDEGTRQIIADTIEKNKDNNQELIKIRARLKQIV